MSSILFEPYKIGGMEIKNRFVRSATWDGMADDSGRVTDSSVGLYRKLGSGGVGLVIIAYSYVTAIGQAAPRQYGIHSDAMVPGLRRLVEAVHRGGARIAAQVVHAGINSRYHKGRGAELPAVSRLEDAGTPHREMTDEEIEALIDDYIAAVLRAREAGFDAVQLHAAHGYGMSQFISPFYNKRTDRWGGSPENRRRFILEVIRRARQAAGDFPLLIKLGVMDDEEVGLVLEEGVEAACKIDEAGIDAIEISSGIGTPVRIIRRDAPEDVYFRERTAVVKRAVSVPVMMVGGIRSLEMAGDIVKSGDADLISMSRPFIREPGLIARWQRGDTARATCISCNKCFSVLARGKPLECGEDRHLREKAARDSKF
jgi:2,4-dienoyl-CoA reductase-like NADH-dependent reductase (Old Yellow Enzyme family)